ncbi:MAG TPA: DUF3187 family protein [Vicinamibacteria bacterium]|nr:DUF3187 family protein [Vicinamibacteria bacterium]
MKRFALLIATVLAAPHARADSPDVPRGPAAIRDAQLLAQPRLTLPAVSPHTTRRGAWEVQVSSLWANSFAWTQDVAGEAPVTRRFLIDGEALVLDATVRRGLARNLDVGVRVPLQVRNGGRLDGFIDWWHRVAHVPDGKRPAFIRDAFRVEGLTTDDVPFSWNDRSGSGLGDLEVETRWRVVEGADGSASVALVARASLPTGTGPFDGNGAGGGGQLVVAAPLGRSFDLYAGAGFTAQGQGPVRGVLYEPVRAHGFLALEWRPWRRVSLVAETDAASRLVENVRAYPGLHWVVNVTGRIDLGERTRLDLGFTENLESQLTTTDFALYLGFAIRP